MSTKHDEYLDENLTSLTHEAMMSMAKRKFDFLKTKGKWGAKSPDDEKIVAMAAQINSLNFEGPAQARSQAQRHCWRGNEGRWLEEKEEQEEHVEQKGTKTG
jgi:hypothetical protein